MKMPFPVISLVVSAIPLVPLQASEKFTDDFSSPLNTDWNVTDGNWFFKDGQAIAEGEFSRLERKDFSAADVEVTADLAYHHNAPHAAAGIQVRLGDDGTGYAVCLREVERGNDPEHGPWERPLLQLFRMEAGGWKLLQEAKVMDGRDGELRKIKVQARGTDLFVYYQDMETPVLREFDDVYQKPGKIALWKDHIGSGMYDNVEIASVGETPTPSLRSDWSWVRGAIYVRSDAVNSVEMWHDYWDHTDTVDRELALAATYGFNMMQVYLHWIVWDAAGDDYLKRINDFLTRAEKYGLKVNLIFWDDCGHAEPSLEFAAPIPGRHNSQMMPNPSHKIRDSKKLLEEHRDRFQSYVASIAARFKDDARISFWQLYNEPMGAKETYRVSETDANIDRLLRWTRKWIKGTGTEIPVTATYGGFQGAKYSDFPTYHSYSGAPGQGLPNADGGPEHLCTETLNRPNAGVGRIMSDIVAKKNGFVAWELMIGRDNCRFPWGHPDGAAEPSAPFHGIVYPDGHPWDVEEVKVMMGEEKFKKLGLFEVTYYKGEFAKELKKSVTPFINFDLGDEPGTGSPDASAGIPKDDFSIRWTGKFAAPQSGQFIFTLQGDGRSRIEIGGKVLPAGEFVKLEKGESYPVTVEYIHAEGDAKLRVSWNVKGEDDELLYAGR